MTLANEAREIRTPNLLIWSQTRYRCAIAPVAIKKWTLQHAELVSNILQSERDYNAVAMVLACARGPRGSAAFAAIAREGHVAWKAANVLSKRCRDIQSLM